MNIIEGNIWDYWKSTNFVGVTTNGIIKKDNSLTMGAGVAKEAADKYPDLPARLGFLVSVYGNLPFIFPEYKIVSFPTKNDWRHKSDLILIGKSCDYLKKIIDYHRKASANIDFYLPKVGCGLGGLDWEKQVKPLLESKFSNYSEIFVCI